MLLGSGLCTKALRRERSNTWIDGPEARPLTGLPGELLPPFLSFGLPLCSLQATGPPHLASRWPGSPSGRIWSITLSVGNREPLLEHPSTLWGAGLSRVLGLHFFSTHTPLSHGSLCLPGIHLPFLSILSYFNLWHTPFTAGFLSLGTSTIWGWTPSVVGLWERLSWVV